MGLNYPHTLARLGLTYLLTIVRIGYFLSIYYLMSFGLHNSAYAMFGITIAPSNQNMGIYQMIGTIETSSKSDCNALNYNNGFN